MKKNNFNNLLGVNLPIIQAPLAGVQDSSLTISVCKSGGLGSLPCGMLSIESIVNEIELIKKNTSNPFNLNFFCHEIVPYDEKKQGTWQSLLKPYFEELNLKCISDPKGASRMPFSHEIADAIESYKPTFISFHFGLP